MKLVVFCDKFLYKNLYDYFSFYNEAGELLGSYFDETASDLYHVVDADYINIAINAVDGLRDIFALMIQKSWYTNQECINICKLMKQLHPESKVIFFMDVPLKDYKYFMHRCATESRAVLATDPESLDDMFQKDLNIEQSQFVLKRVKRKEKKLFNVY